MAASQQVASQQVANQQVASQQVASQLVAISSAALRCTRYTILTCTFRVSYGNNGTQPLGINALTTTVRDAPGRTFSPVTHVPDAASLLVNPGLARSVWWSVQMPSGAQPLLVVWRAPDGTELTTTLELPQPAVSATTNHEQASAPAPVPAVATQPAAAWSQDPPELPEPPASGSVG